MEFLPAFDFARKKHKVSINEDGRVVSFDSVDDTQPLSIQLQSSSLKVNRNNISKAGKNLLSDGIVAEFQLEEAQPEMVNFFLRTALKQNSCS